MRLNEHTAVSSSRLLLVPYDAHHVPTYHEWMADPAIQEATASEPLTLEEEYENQVSWRTSGDKLTFILCLTENKNEPSSSPSSSRLMGTAQAGVVRAGQADAPERMIGDINLFLTPWDEVDTSDDDGGGGATGDVSHVNGEIDIMIASPAHRRLGLGSEAVTALLRYIAQHAREILAEYAAFTAGTSSSTSKGQHQEQEQEQQEQQQYILKDLVAKINASNEGSIALFKRLGFRQRGEVNYFGEVQLVLEDFGGKAADIKDERSGAAHRELSWDRTGLN
ncbi:GNAT domain-domain-containing protein [Microdochium bolleyi]|uniref:GNAT domain-domain-containing protein n=1 Tax=Microdochium bolleyi TaxID=196109 RepID=A0A136J825_9PEZI|nr:GNAT domain-domain-containing protein [Microdochium bolleyi]